MMWHLYAPTAWVYVLIAIGMIILVALTAAVVSMLWRRPSLPEHPAIKEVSSSPEQALAERFARGEINEDEYPSRLNTLRAPSARSRG